MKKYTRVEPVPRLSPDRLRRSREGTLGRFPSGDLYEPEPEKGQAGNHLPESAKLGLLTGKR